MENPYFLMDDLAGTPHFRKQPYFFSRRLFDLFIWKFEHFYVKTGVSEDVYVMVMLPLGTSGMKDRLCRSSPDEMVLIASSGSCAVNNVYHECVTKSVCC